MQNVVIVIPKHSLEMLLTMQEELRLRELSSFMAIHDDILDTTDVLKDRRGSLRIEKYLGAPATHRVLLTTGVLNNAVPLTESAAQGGPSGQT